VLGCPDWLVCWLAGPEVEVMESLPLAALGSSLGALVRRATGDPALPNPEEVVRTQWVVDPAFRGTYSYPGLRTEVPRHQLALGRPVLDAGGVARWGKQG
jgi:hypothetical protein